MTTDTHATDDDTVQGEVTDDQPNTRQDAAREAVDAIAEMALTTPGLPGRDEFLVLCMEAKVLSLSPGVKKGYRNNPHLCLQVMLIGRELGIGPTTALEMIDPIPDKDNGYRPSLGPKLLNARLAQLGLGRMVPLQKNAAGVVLECRGPHNEVLGPPAEFTWEDAQAAGMAGPDCHPSEDGRHIVHNLTRPWDRKGNNAPCGCKATYFNYPKRMLTHRATGYAADDYYPGARLGLYSPDELGAVTDEEGRALDPATVELPEGFEPPPPPPAEVADPADLEDLVVRSAALPDDLKAALRQRWNQSRLRGVRIGDLTPEGVALANSILRGLEADARRQGHDLEAAQAAVRASRATEGGAQAPAPADGAPEAPQAGPEPEAPEPTAAPEPAPVPAAAAPKAEGPDPVAAAPDPEELTDDDTAVLRAGGVALMDAQIAYVKPLRGFEVDDSLRQRQLPTEGDLPARKTRLVVALVREELEAHAEAQRVAAEGPPPEGGTLFVGGDPPEGGAG